jgi:hypothetical protein
VIIHTLILFSAQGKPPGQLAAARFIDIELSERYNEAQPVVFPL